MQFVKNDNRYIIRLSKGESLIKNLIEMCSSENITAAFFYGLGGVLSAELAYYNLETKKYQTKKFEGTREIVALSGNVTRVKDYPFIHAHTVLSDENYECRGGHLTEALVGGTCEIHLFKEDIILDRQLDEETGLKLINCNL